MDNRTNAQPQAQLASPPHAASLKASPTPPCPHAVKALADLAQVARQVI